MLNWKEIFEKYPNAYNKLVGETAEEQMWICNDYEPYREINTDNAWNDNAWNDNFLNYFFDSHEIYGFPGHNWFPEIYNNTSRIWKSKKSYKNRRASEEVLWMMEFQNLENKLKKAK